MAKKVLARIDTNTGVLTDFTNAIYSGFDGITVNDTVLFVVQFKESLTSTQTDLDLTGATALRVTIRSARNPNAQLWSFQDTYNDGNYATNENLSEGKVTWLMSFADADLVSALGNETSVAGFLEFTWLDAASIPQTLGTYPISVFNEVDDGASGTPPPSSPTYLTATEIAALYLKKKLGNWDEATELTIASGAVTATQTTHRIDTQADAAADNLDTISFAAVSGDEFQLVLMLENSARIVTITEAGNIVTPDGSNYVMDEGAVYLNYDNAAAKWRLNASSIGGDALTSNPLSQFAATTSAQLAGVLSDETGTSLAVFNTSPTLVTPLLGTPTSGVLTNCTGTASGLTVGATTGVEAGADVTDATNVAAALTLTGDVTTSAGFATTIAAKAVHVSMLDDGTDGELITWDASGNAATVATGTSGHILTSGGAGVAPTFQANSAGAPEGTSVLSTSETVGKVLQADGDDTCSWVTLGGGGDALVANPLSQFAATTSLQLLGVMSDETGTGAVVFATSPTLVTPALGTPASGVLTNTTGLPVTGLANGTDGELITWSAAGVAETVAVGTAAQVLTSNGAGAAPTFQAAAGGGSTVMALIDSVDVGTAKTTHTFSSLDGDVDLNYIIKARIVNALAGTNIVYCRPNNDSTTSNYAYQNLQGATSTASAAQVTTGSGVAGIEVCATRGSGLATKCHIELDAEDSAYRLAFVNRAELSAAGTVNFFAPSCYLWDATGNITSIVITGPTDVLGVGTRIELWAIR